MRIRDWSSDVCSSDLTIQVEVRKKRVFVKRDPAELVAEAKAAAIESDEAVQPEAAAPVVAPEVGSEVAPRVDLDQVSAASPAQERSEERREGKESVSQCRYRWSPYL